MNPTTTGEIMPNCIKFIAFIATSAVAHPSQMLSEIREDFSKKN